MSEKIHNSHKDIHPISRLLTRREDEICLAQGMLSALLELLVSLHNSNGRKEKEMKIGEIEKGIPMPPEPPKRHTGPKKIYPFDKMKLGDSIFCELQEGDVPRKIRGNLKSSYGRYTKSLGFKFEIRAITNSEEEITGFRIWRTE